MSTELAKAYVQIVPSAEGISGSISDVLSGEATRAGRSAGENIAGSLAGKLAAGLAALGIGKVVSDSISAGTEYQTSIAKLGTIADSSAVSMDTMKSQIAAMSDEMGISQAAIAEGAYSVISATGDTAGALDIVSQSAKLATAGFTDTDSAVSVLTTSLNAYGLEASDVEHISDSLVTTQNLGVTTVAELASNMGRAIATASGYGVSLENLEAAYISTTKSGISTAESTTYLSSMMAELGKDGSDVSNILKDQTGQSFGELMDSGASLGDVLGVLMDSVDGNAEAFMNLWGSQEAGKAANAIVNQGLDTFNENLSTLETQAGTTQAAYEQMTDTFAWKSQDLQTKVQNLGISFFESIYPVLDQLVEKATEFVDGLDMEALGTQISELVTNVAPMITAIGDALVFVAQNIELILPVIGTLMGFGIATKIIGVVTAVGGLFSGVTALAPVLAALTGPVGLVISVVAALAAGIVTLWNTNEGFRSAVIAIWEAIKSGVSTAINTLSSVISSVWNGIKSNVTGIMNGIKSTFTSAWNGIKSTVSSVINGIKSTISSGLNGAKATVSSVLTSIKTKFSTIWNGAKSIVSSAISAIKGKMNFSWSLPKLKLPHISISGSFSITPPSAPHFSISWYKKAMDTPFMFTAPTIFGMNSAGQMLGAGEAGDEVMIGKNTMLGMMRSAVAAEVGSRSAGENITINVYGAQGQSEERIASAVMDELNARLRLAGAMV